jgi:hypothetical protein
VKVDFGVSVGQIEKTEEAAHPLLLLSGET